MLRGLALGTIVISIFFMLVYKITGALLPSPWKRIYTSYISVSLPDDWSCVQESTEWVCRSSKYNDVLSVFTAKVVGPSDSREIYTEYLNTPKEISNKEGNKVKSEVLEVKSKHIRDIDWVYGRQISSLLYQYESHYYATIHKNVAILFTFTFHVDSREQYEEMSEQIAASFHVTL